MKVCFDATFDDFVDINKRSAGNTLWSYVSMILVNLVVSIAGAAVSYFIFGDWLIAVIVVTIVATVSGFTLLSSREQNLRAFLKKRLKVDAPVPTEVEIDESGITFRCLGQTTTQKWELIENIEETDDAVYFRNVFGIYSSVRKRGFQSDEELRQFKTLANQYWSEATIPEPPTFEPQT